MKWLLLAFFCVHSLLSQAQNIQGKWIGKLTQLPGGYSQLYDIELNLSQRKTIWGDSFATEGDSVRVRIGLSGHFDGDTLRLRESHGWIREDRVPFNWVACIKDFALAYRQDGNMEYLEGRWFGVSKNNWSEACQPGRVVLSRTIEGFNKFLIENKDSAAVMQSAIAMTEHPPVIDFSAQFRNTEAKKVTEIIVNNSQLQIRLVDYMKVDNDTVSVYLNRYLIAERVRIAKRPAILNLRLDTRVPLHEVLLYAENLGEIPPNTSEMTVIDGDKRHRVMIVSDTEKTAAVYLRYIPKSGS